MKIAALDLGSNTFLCLIADVNEAGVISIISDSVEVVRLGEGLFESEQFSIGALSRAKECLTRFAKIIQQNQPINKVKAVATAAARKSKNVSELEKICKDLEIPLTIISGEEEALLTFSGSIVSDFGLEEYLVIDIGGGSTELVYGSNSGIHGRKSFEIGVVKLKEQFIFEFPISFEIEKKIQSEIEKVFQDISFIQNDKQLNVLAVAGTPTTLVAAILGEFDVNKIDGFTLSLNSLAEWREKLLKLKPNEIEVQFKIPKGRADVILVGVMILESLLKKLNCSKLTVSSKGLRFGLAKSLI